MSETFTVRICVEGYFGYSRRIRARLIFMASRSNSYNNFLPNRSYINCAFFKKCVLRNCSKPYIGLALIRVGSLGIRFAVVGRGAVKLSPV